MEENRLPLKAGTYGIKQKEGERQDDTEKMGTVSGNTRSGDDEDDDLKNRSLNVRHLLET